MGTSDERSEMVDFSSGYSHSWSRNYWHWCPHPPSPPLPYAKMRRLASVKRCWDKYGIQCQNWFSVSLSQLICHNRQGLPTRLPAVSCAAALGERAYHGFELLVISSPLHCTDLCITYPRKSRLPWGENQFHFGAMSCKSVDRPWNAFSFYFVSSHSRVVSLRH